MTKSDSTIKKEINNEICKKIPSANVVTIAVKDASSSLNTETHAYYACVPSSSVSLATLAGNCAVSEGGWNAPKTTAAPPSLPPSTHKTHKHTLTPPSPHPPTHPHTKTQTQKQNQKYQKEFYDEVGDHTSPDVSLAV